MKPEAYTLFIASSRKGTFRKIRVPVYVLHLLALLAVVGGITVLAGASSYTRMLWKVGEYNTLRRQQTALKHNYERLETTVQDTNQRLDSLQSLATEVAVTYGFMRFRQSPFALNVNEVPAGAETGFERTVAQFNFLEKNSGAASLPMGALQLLPAPGLGDPPYTPSLWPVIGHLTGHFGERMDPFSGEGAFHTGVDISTEYGDPVRASADGVVVVADSRAGYGRLVIVDHGFGLTTWYGHLSSIHVIPGQVLKRGDSVGNVGVSGRTTGPHVHYEVRINGAPVNPMRYLRHALAAD